MRLPPRLGGPNEPFESSGKITDVWCLPTSGGKNGHGAEFPLALPGRCIALSTEPGDLVLDPFIGSGTTAIAALALNRRCVGFDMSEEYVRLAKKRVAAARSSAVPRWDDDDAVQPDSNASATERAHNGKTSGAHVDQLVAEGIVRTW